MLRGVLLKLLNPLKNFLGPGRQYLVFLIAEFPGARTSFSARTPTSKFFSGARTSISGVFDCWISGARTSFSARTPTSKIFSGARTSISGVFDCWISGARTSFSVSLGGNADFSGPTLISPSFAMVFRRGGVFLEGMAGSIYQTPSDNIWAMYLIDKWTLIFFKQKIFLVL